MVLCLHYTGNRRESVNVSRVCEHGLYYAPLQHPFESEFRGVFECELFGRIVQQGFEKLKMVLVAKPSELPDFERNERNKRSFLAYLGVHFRSAPFTSGPRSTATRTEGYLFPYSAGLSSDT